MLEQQKKFWKIYEIKIVGGAKENIESTKGKNKKVWINKIKYCTNKVKCRTNNQISWLSKYGYHINIFQFQKNNQNKKIPDLNIYMKENDFRKF